MDKSKKSGSIWLRRAVFSTIIAGPVALMLSTSTASALAHSTYRTAAIRNLAQDDDSVPDEDTVPPDKVAKYIAVYSAMQKDHSLTVAQATSKQGLTVDEFRSIEDKIQRNPIVHERVLNALKASATGAKTAKSATVPKDQ